MDNTISRTDFEGKFALKSKIFFRTPSPVILFFEPQTLSISWNEETFMRRAGVPRQNVPLQAFSLQL